MSVETGVLQDTGVVRTHCECGFRPLHGLVTVEFSHFKEKRESGYLLISKRCPYGPPQDGVFVESGEGYTIFKTAKPEAPLFG